MLFAAANAISRPFQSLFAKSGTDMEPDLFDSQLDEDQAECKENEHLFRLFVGWVPKLFTENDLLPLFQKYGDVKDIIILKDKMTGQPRGCAFVSYATKVEAEAAIQSLDKGVHLPGALCPMEVRYARSHQYVQAGSGPQDNRQLFFARAPPLITEPEIQQLFTQFGEVEEINLFRERRSHLSKGCGFVTMATREQAIAAMAALDEKQLLEGSATPLAVKWADPELQIKKRRAVEDSNAENRMLFFAKVLRSASEDEVRALFQQYGRVVEVNLFRAFQGAPTTKGCGLVTMGGNEEAAAAIDALDNRHIWEGMEAPMVVKWMDAALQKRRREEHLAAMRQGLVPSMSMSPDVWLSSKAAAGGGGTAGSSRSAGLSHGKLLDAATAAAAAAAAAGKAGPAAAGVGPSEAAAAAAGGGVAAAAAVAAVAASASVPTEMPPVGCAPDAYKLFVGNIPKTCTEEELRPVFESVGPVVELVVVRDKFTHESKGSAFVWYTTKADADKAVVQFNLCRVLSDPTGEQDRPLVVRRANMRKPAAAMMLPHQGIPGSGSGTGTAAAGGPGSGMVAPLAGVPAAAVAAVGGPLTGAGSGSLGGPGTGSIASGGSIGMVDLSGSMAASSVATGEVPLHLQPLVTMQVQQQQPPYPMAGQVGMYPAPLAAQYGALSDGGSSNSGLVIQQFGGTAGAGGMMQPQQPQQPGMALPQQQPQQPQQRPQPQQYILAQPMVAAAQPPMMAISQAAAPCGPLMQMALQLSPTQMSMLSPQLYSIVSMSGCDISTIPAANGMFLLNMAGLQSQVDSARGFVMSLLSQMQAAGMM